MSYTALLKQTCTIKRKTITIGNRGQTNASWNTIASAVKCAIQITTSQQEEYRLDSAGEYSETSYMGFFLYGTDVLEGDKIIDNYGRTFHVGRVGEDTVGYKHHIEADLEIVRE